MEASIPKIISGGQTGADRAALDWALSHNLPCGGWCPKGRKAEDGIIAAKYPLKESSSSSYIQRTEWNVRDSDGTIVLSIAATLSGGSEKTLDLARKHCKPYLHILAGQTNAADRLRTFLAENVIHTLNVAGPRESKETSLAQFVVETLDRVFGTSDRTQD